MTKRVLKLRNKSPKTSFYGKLQAIIGILVALLLLVDGDPTTWPDITDLMEFFGVLGIVIPNWLMGIAARDNDVSSEDVGLKA